MLKRVIKRTLSKIAVGDTGALLCSLHLYYFIYKVLQDIRLWSKQTDTIFKVCKLKAVKGWITMPWCSLGLFRQLCNHDTKFLLHIFHQYAKLIQKHFLYNIYFQIVCYYNFARSLWMWKYHKVILSIRVYLIQCSESFSI